MTVADLIAELQRHPPLRPVRLRIDGVSVETEIGEKYVPGPWGPVDIQYVTNEGNFIQLDGES